MRTSLGRHGRARPGHPAGRALARLTSPLRGEVGAPGRAKRDPGKPGEGACSFAPNRWPPAAASPPPRPSGGRVRAPLGRHGRARPGRPAALSLARLTSPLRGEVGAPGRAQRDPGKPGEGAFCSGPHGSPACGSEPAPRPSGGHVRPPLGRHGRARPGHPAAGSLARLTSPLPGRGRRAWSSAARPRQAG